MSGRALRPIAALFPLALGIGCPPPAPPATGTSGPIGVAVTAPPPDWTYKVTPTAPATFDAVEIVAAINHQACTGRASSTIWIFALAPDGASSTFASQMPGQNTPETFHLSCPDTGTGPVYVIVSGQSGGVRFRRVIGPLAGPS